MKQIDYRAALTTELRLLNLAPNTIKCYVGLLGPFINEFGSPARCSVEQLKQYILKRKCVRTQKQIRAMLIHLYKRVLKQPEKMLSIPNPKQPQVLPKVLSVKEIRRIVKCTNNYKHLALLSVSYCCALRVSELCNIKLQHICFETNSLLVKAGKGRKDRIIPFNEKLAVLLKNYIAKYKCSNYLFEGQFGDAYTPTSAQKVLQAAAAKAAIRFKPTIHTLRHCRATHLLNGKLDIHILSQLLGHSKLETTQVYLHLSRRQMADHILAAEQRLVA